MTEFFMYLIGFATGFLLGGVYVWKNVRDHLPLKLLDEMEALKRKLGHGIKVRW